MRVGLMAMALLAVAWAGCAEEGTSTELEDEAFNELDAKATEDTGVIRGVVVDPSITPIEGVTLSILNDDRSTLSNENGAFVFTGLAPGSYFISAEKAGFSSVQQGVDVVAAVDNPPVIKMQLQPDASTAPHVSTMVYEAYIQCSESLLLVGYSGGCENDFLRSYAADELGRTPDFAQSEMIWESTQPAGDWMTLVYSAPGDGVLLHNYQDEEGPSPQVVRANRTLMEENGVIGEYPLQLRIFNSGIEGTDIGRDYGDPVDGDDCIERPGLGGCATGLGATIDQQISVFTHAFFNMLPEEGWQFSVDGEPARP